MKLKAAFIAMLLPLSASAADLTTVDETRAECSQAARLFAAGQYDAAYRGLAPYWPLPEQEILNLGYQTKTQLEMVTPRFGASLGEEHVETITAGQSLVRHTYLIKHERHALRFSCVFYSRRTPGW